jgi:hypothetical protein
LNFKGLFIFFGGNVQSDVQTGNDLGQSFDWPFSFLAFRGNRRGNQRYLVRILGVDRDKFDALFNRKSSAVLDLQASKCQTRCMNL